MPTSASASSTTSHSPDLLFRLTSSDEEVQLKALRELKNRIIGNRTKKLSFVKLGLVPSVADILASKLETRSNEGSSSLLLQAAAVLGSFACGFDSGVQAVLDSGAFPNLFRLISHPDEKVIVICFIYYCA